MKKPLVPLETRGLVYIEYGGEGVRQIKIHHKPKTPHNPLYYGAFKPIIVSRHLPTFVTFLAVVGEQMGEQNR